LTHINNYIHFTDDDYDDDDDDDDETVGAWPGGI
jgi:hypothetical protein